MKSNASMNGVRNLLLLSRRPVLTIARRVLELRQSVSMAGRYTCVVIAHRKSRYGRHSKSIDPDAHSTSYLCLNVTSL